MSGRVPFKNQVLTDYNGDIMNEPLPNYIRTFRRRYHLSQDDVAHLLGYSNGTTVLRHEDFQRIPSLQQALAYAVIFGVDPRELFAGRYAEAERKVKKRVTSLLSKAPSTDRTNSPTSLTYLETLIASSEPTLVPWED